MNYSKALKKWNSMGSQQNKSISMSHVWASPRRGTPAQEEVREFMKEKPPKTDKEIQREKLISDKISESKRTGEPVYFDFGLPQESSFGRAVREIRERTAVRP